MEQEGTTLGLDWDHLRKRIAVSIVLWDLILIETRARLRVGIIFDLWRNWCRQDVIGVQAAEGSAVNHDAAPDLEEEKRCSNLEGIKIL